MQISAASGTAQQATQPYPEPVEYTATSVQAAADTPTLLSPHSQNETSSPQLRSPEPREVEPLEPVAEDVGGPVGPLSVPSGSGAVEGLEGAQPAQAEGSRGYDDPPEIAGYSGSPSDLKKIGEIQPFYDYEPDPDVLAEDPCRYLCPRPDGLPCKKFDDPDQVPECPEEVKLGEETYGGRHLPEGMFAWVAPNITYRPLYYEDPALERYGHTYWGPVQSLVSVGRFGVQTVSLPYQASLHPYCKDVYPLGWYRPGECAPKKCYQPPLSARAGLTQASWMTGLFFLIP